MSKKFKFSKAGQQQLDDYGKFVKTALDIGLKEDKDVVIHQTFVDAELVKVIKNTKTEWCAKYADDYGTYKFSLKKKGNKYFVESDGVKFNAFTDLDFVVWEYESQLEQVRNIALVIKDNSKRAKVFDNSREHFPMTIIANTSKNKSTFDATLTQILNEHF